MRSPHVLQLIMDSLRYWVTEMHVDGFRFDLAATLARQFHEVDRLSAFFDLVQQDPVVSRVKLIAEPWDVGDGGYQVGNFPPLWSEWNGRYRDTVRDFWRGEAGALPELASRLTGSSDLYAGEHRRPRAGINFVTAHDGFTLRDLVSYNDKHNEANGEDNRDGESHNRSWNCGAEGDTDDRDVLTLRARQQRNLLTTLLVSQGVPMIATATSSAAPSAATTTPTARTARLPGSTGTSAPEQRELLDFTRRLIALRRDHPVFRRRRFFRGGPGRAGGPGDLTWLRPDGRQMARRRLGPRRRPRGGRPPQRRRDLRAGRARGADHRRLVPAAVQRHWEQWCSGCRAEYGRDWRVVVDTAADADAADESEVKAGGTISVPARGTIILTCPRRRGPGRVRRALSAAARRPRVREPADPGRR